MLLLALDLLYKLLLMEFLSNKLLSLVPDLQRNTLPAVAIPLLNR